MSMERLEEAIGTMNRRKLIGGSTQPATRSLFGLATSTMLRVNISDPWSRGKWKDRKFRSQQHSFTTTDISPKDDYSLKC